MNILEEATCPVCFEILSDPHMLTCSHNVCRNCTNFICHDNAAGIVEFCCPVCRGSTTEAQLMPNISLRNIVEVLLHGQRKEISANCSRCETKKATLGCQDCQRQGVMLLCAECSSTMHQGKLASHKVGEIQDIVTKEAGRCVHHEKKLALWCEDDKGLICAHCTYDEHLGHKVTPLAMAAKKALPTLQDHLEQAVKLKTRLHLSICEIDELVEVDMIKKVGLKEAAARAFGDIRRALYEKERSLLAQIDEIFIEPLAVRAELTKKIARINVLHSTSQRLKTLDDGDIMQHLAALTELKEKVEPIQQTNRVFGRTYTLQADPVSAISAIARFSFEDKGI